MTSPKSAIGIDLLEIGKIRQSHKRFGAKFLSRVLTKREMAYCRGKKNFYQSVGARFAAKEAFKKAFSHYSDAFISWQEVEVVSGKKVPALKVSLRVKRILGKKNVGVSLSHTESFAIAIVLISG